MKCEFGAEGEPARNVSADRRCIRYIRLPKK